MSDILETANRQDSRYETDQRPVICIVGQGYVGLPLAHEFDRAGYDVIGYDIDPEKIARLCSGTDPTGDLGDETIENSEITFTDDRNAISRASFVLVTVPTPIDDLKNPDLEYVRSAGETIGRSIQPGTIVVLESTVYPGATREVLAPAIEQTSDLQCGDGFFIGYSPERVVPGDDEHTVRNITKVVSAQNEEVLDEITALYESIVDIGVHRASEIEIAETTKCIENIQRDLNIALVNELAVACENIGVDTKEVLEAARTKWNFHDYRPGLVGGHCIPVDPFYIIYESERNGFTPNLIRQARTVNEHVPVHIGELVIKSLNDCEKVPQRSSVLVLGLAYKPGVGDVRTSAVGGTIAHLEGFGVDVIGFDPHAETNVTQAEFEIDVQESLSFDDVDGIILATAHEEFRSIDYRKAAEAMADDPFIVDVDTELDPDEMVSLGFNYRRL
ncbi:nucleotide sugar dehydrogenase [Halomontanus rarus]|uniref:nucleotide sugar dehydrogenase n=1 Tax=Halomontanus rarus TaxID=3034020 RepID=UPI001A98DC7B